MQALPTGERRLPLLIGRAPLSYVALALMLLVSAVRFPGLVSDFLAPAWPVIVQWRDPEAQARQSTFTPYDLLQAAGNLLPRDAVVLLITPGDDVRHRDYTAYHRALYYLAPRSVWWQAPAARDGTWESRWWIARPVTAQSIRELAVEKGAGYVLLLDAAALPDLGTTVLARDDGALVRLGPPQPPPGSLATYAGVLWPLEVALATAVVLAAGGLLLHLAASLGYRATDAEAWALAWLLGMGATTVALLGMSAAGVRLGTQIVLWSLAVSGTWVVILLRRSGVVVRSPSSPASRQEPRAVVAVAHAGLVAWLGVNVTLVALLAMGRPLEAWDSWAVWGVKARAIWSTEGIPPAVYADPSRASTLPAYPLLVPLAEAWYYGWLGAPDDRLAGVPALAFYLALIGLSYAAVRRDGRRVLALAAGAAIASLAPIALGAGLVYADVPLAAYVLGAATLFRVWRNGAPRGALLVAALCAGLMPWTKREGWVLLLALCAAAALLGRSDRRAWRGTGALIAGALALAGPWALFVALRGLPDVVYLPFVPATLVGNIARVPVVARLALSALTDLPWSGLWLLAPLCALAARRRARRDALLPATALLYLLLVGASYVWSDYVPYQQHVVSSIGRLAVQVAPMAVVWIAGMTAAADQRTGDDAVRE